MTELSRFVAYYRMPSATDSPRVASLARQKAAVAAFLDDPDRTLVGEFTEASGSTADERPGATPSAFDLALECCGALNATLVVALTEETLGERALDAARRAGTDVVTVEPVSQPVKRPEDGREPIPDEEGAEAVPYLPLGTRRRAPQPPPPKPARPVGNREKADAFARAILPIIEQIRAQGATSLSDIADELNARQIRTARGRRWHAATVRNVLNRAGGGEDA